MRNRFALSLVLACVLVGACAAQRTLEYSYVTNLQENVDRNTQLTKAIERVLTRRIAAMKAEGSVAVIPSSQSSGNLTVHIPSGENADRMEQILSEEFIIDFRVEEPQVITGSQPTDVAANWKKTGVTNSDIEWIQMIGDNATGEIGIEIIFTNGGRDKLSEVFKANVGENLGIFVRDLLVSSLKIKSDTVSSHVIISGLPSAKVAEAFADDVNVGMHVKFTPVAK